MRHGCLGLFDCFNPSDDPEEQTPIATNGRMEDSKRLYDSISEPPPSDGEKPPMGVIRKVLFVLSLNAGVAFAAVLLWAIPCRVPPCTVEHGWDHNMSALLTSNMETVKIPSRSNAIVFCLADQSGGHLASLNTTDGEMLWNQTLSDSFCRNVFCEFGRPLEINEKKICIVTGFNFIGAVDATSGKMVWQQNHTDPSGETIHTFALSALEGFPHLLGISENYIYSVDAKNGTIVSVALLPCSSVLSVKIAGPWIVGNETLWTLVCLSGDSIAVWTFEEGDVLSPAEGRNPRDDVGFDLLFRSIVFGHFTDPKKMQLAVAVQDEKNMTIHILDAKSGSKEAVSQLGGGSVMSMEKIPGRDGETDTLLIESIQGQERSDDSQTHLPEHTSRSYFTMRYNKKSVMYQTLASSDVYASTLKSLSEGTADLLTATKTPDDGTTLRRMVITTAIGPFCRADDLQNTTIVITRE